MKPKSVPRADAVLRLLPTLRAAPLSASGLRCISASEIVDGELTPGFSVAGKYRIMWVLGRGGSATVYEAQHSALGRRVALKVLHCTSETPAVLLERFAREVRISALVRHPNVLEVYDAGTLDDGSPFLVMEKIHGTTLSEHVENIQRVRAVRVDEVKAIATQLLLALTALAEHGIVHRDVKPENVMVSVDALGRPQLKLVDFGIALAREPHLDTRLTMQGAVIGTPHYMAPEQLRSQVVDARVDLYATGVVLYQALTGRLPFDGASLPSLALNVLHGEMRSVRDLRPDCPPALARVLECALSRDPASRYESAASMLLALHARERASDVGLWSSPFRLLSAPRGPSGFGVLQTGLRLAMAVAALALSWYIGTVAPLAPVTAACVPSALETAPSVLVALRTAGETSASAPEQAQAE